jgi:hypothetical protein
MTNAANYREAESKNRDPHRAWDAGQNQSLTHSKSMEKSSSGRAFAAAQRRILGIGDK